jgi:hypothetical protein
VTTLEEVFLKVAAGIESIKPEFEPDRELAKVDIEK